MTTVVEVLTKARALIEDPARWTTGWYARDANGRAVPDIDAAAVCWCMSGAIWRVAKGDSFAIHDAHEVLKRFTGSVNVFNDSHTHADVLAAFDKAIAKAEA